MRIFGRLAPLLATAALFACANPALAAGACAAFAWDVHHEQALFATQPQDKKAGGAVASAPSMSLDRLYRLSLAPQEQVAFAVQPGKKTRTGGAHAGLVRLHIARSGLYRVALSGRFWIDVVKDGKLIASAAFTGARGCNAPRKIVLYRLVAGDILLQLSGGASPQTELTVTRAPSRGST
ncbi:MAG TPA: hypothetical protein VGT07_05690 [Steroidobacteraceae bacterium]|nr:hypothetical protein [Steroidobacteraceae bacterium]